VQNGLAVDTADPGLSVCLAPVAAWPLTDALAMLGRIGARRFGVLAPTLAVEGPTRRS